MDFKEVPSEEKEKYFIDKYRGKVKFAGPHHGRIKQIQSLISNTKPNPNRFFIIEGIWACEKALEYNLQIEAFLFCPELIFSSESIKIVDDFINVANDSYMVSKKVLLKVSERDNPDGLLAICRLPVHTIDDIRLKDRNIIVVLDGLEIPGNIGTIIRAVDGAGGDGILICNHKARLTHPKLIKSSQGSNFKIPVIELDTDEAIKWLNKNDFSIILTDTRAERGYYEEGYEGRIAIVAGSEKYGISEKWYDNRHKMVSIPMHGDCDSLNVAIATSIVLYEAKLKQEGKYNSILRI